MGSFEVCGKAFEEMDEAVREAERLHAWDGRPREVVALSAEPQQWETGEAVYRSLGPAQCGQGVPDLAGSDCRSTAPPGTVDVVAPTCGGYVGMPWAPRSFLCRSSRGQAWHPGEAVREVHES